jgi:hypothetical protein
MTSKAHPSNCLTAQKKSPEPFRSGETSLSPFQTQLPISEEIQMKIAMEAAQKTQELLELQGWCFWKCYNLDNETIVITRDENVGNCPAGYTRYTLNEVTQLCRDDINESGLHLIHRIKKEGAVIVTAVKKS